MWKYMVRHILWQSGLKIWFFFFFCSLWLHNKTSFCYKICCFDKLREWSMELSLKGCTVGPMFPAHCLQVTAVLKCVLCILPRAATVASSWGPNLEFLKQVPSQSVVIRPEPKDDHLLLSIEGMIVVLWCWELSSGGLYEGPLFLVGDWCIWLLGCRSPFCQFVRHFIPQWKGIHWRTILSACSSKPIAFSTWGSLSACSASRTDLASVRKTTSAASVCSVHSWNAASTIADSSAS